MKPKAPSVPIKQVVFTALACVLIFGFVEGLLRMVPISWIVNAPAFVPSDTVEFHISQRENFVLDGRLLWRARPNHLVAGRYRTNAQGFRSPSITEAPRDARLVLCMGDSCTFGWGI